MVKVIVNGIDYFADVYGKILYTDRTKKNGTPFSYLPKEDLEQVIKQIRFK